MAPDAALRRELARLGAPRQPVDLDTLQPMLAETASAPFSSAGWLFELKHDGFRLLAERRAGAVRLKYRSGAAATTAFPEVEEALRALPGGDFVVDGEVVVFAASGRPSFQALQKRFQLRRAQDVASAARRLPASLCVFDLLALDGHDLRALALLERKRLLRRFLPEDPVVHFTDHVERDGSTFYATVRERGLEGMVAKRTASPYVPGRSPQWLKVRVDRTVELAVVGFTLPAGGRAGFGALHLAEWDGSAFVYAGRVGSGFDDAELSRLRRTLEATRAPRPTCGGRAPAGRDHVWVEPALVCEVRYKERTEEGLLRQPVFLRFRSDRTPAECTFSTEVIPPAAGVPTRFTNADKVFWPDEGYTKGDLVAYYRAVARWLLPYLHDRPVVLTRYPDGIAGKSFFQKDRLGQTLAGLRAVSLWSEASRRSIEYFLCDGEDGLAALANLGSIVLHVWSSRVAALERPDWCILDLDPKGASFADVVALAQAARRLCDELGLPCFAKTSGASGLHVLVGLGAQCTFEQSRSLAHLMAWTLVREHGDRATIDRPLRARQGKVYVDYLQNGHGQLLVAPFSVRPLRGAPVSTPLRWSEVKPGLDPARFTMRTVVSRLRRAGEDPLRGVLGAQPDLVAALSALQRRLG
jgi:bifunctional non-homologous end joining protein LigD